MSVVKFPYDAGRRVHSRKPRRSKNGTPEERAPATAAIAPASPACAIDPVFELIEIHRKAHAAHMVSLELQSRFDRRYGGGGGWISEKPCCDEDDAFEAFVAAPATTMQGLGAKLAYFEELASEFETEWMVYDRVGCSALIESLTLSLKNIGVLA